MLTFNFVQKRFPFLSFDNILIKNCWCKWFVIQITNIQVKLKNDFIINIVIKILGFNGPLQILLMNKY